MSKAAIPVEEWVEHTSKGENTRKAESFCENKRANREENVCENQQLCEKAQTLVVEEGSVESKIKTSGESMIANASQSGSAAREPREC